MNALKPVLAAVGESLGREVPHARVAEMVRPLEEKSLKLALKQDSAAFSKAFAEEAPKAQAGLIHNVLAYFGLAKPTEVEAKWLVQGALEKHAPELSSPTGEFKVHVRPFKNDTFVFSARAERVDSIVPYASGYRPLTVLGQFDPAKRAITEMHTINRTPLPSETGERIFMEDVHEHVRTPLDLLPF